MLEGNLNPKDYEDKIYKRWEDSKAFRPKGSGKPFVIAMPPPNVTGVLHMGHALDISIQDVLIRYKRLKGFDTLWVPGTDHASIATEAKVVEKLKSEGKTKYELGREGFLEEAWAWTDKFGSAIVNQQKQLGASADWDRSRFTLDEGLTKAVLQAFIKLYDDGLIYKGKRITNYCVSCNTAISEIEIDFVEDHSHLWYIKYPLLDGNNNISDEYLTVATTRPETMLGDTAIAVNPDDENLSKYVGRKVMLPLVDRIIPVIADVFVDTEFGTGAVKITPAHDTNDYQAGLRHDLEQIEVFGIDLEMYDIVPKYKGMDIYTARKEIVKDLKEKNYLLKTEDYVHNIGKCSRCKTVIEPLITDQYFVKMDKLAEIAMDAVRKGDTKFIPDRFSKNFFNWMENIQDWCISRQLWWGHRIPVYVCQDCNEVMVADSSPEKCSKCSSTNILQEEDTLDTWFSSALWPFSILGWPDETSDIRKYFPNSVLVTGFDIITFWVARMLYMSLYLMGEAPFSDVLIHGLVRAEDGRKMSKSLGNGIDPIEEIERYSADALRFALNDGVTKGNDFRYSEEKIKKASNFSNKIWNAAKYIVNNENFNLVDKDISMMNVTTELDLKYEDKWILSKFNSLILDVEADMETYDFGPALAKIYDFAWNSFCSWYIELSKARLIEGDSADKHVVMNVLNLTLKGIMKVLHPFMPFITTVIYDALVKTEDEYSKENYELMLADWPIYIDDMKYVKEEEAVEIIQNLISNIRNIRTENKVQNNKKTKLYIDNRSTSVDTERAIVELQSSILKMALLTEIQFVQDIENIDDMISIILPGIKAYILRGDLIDKEVEIERLEKEKLDIEKKLTFTNNLLNNKGFVEKAPEQKINEEKNKQDEYTRMLEEINKSLDNLR